MNISNRAGMECCEQMASMNTTMNSSAGMGLHHKHEYEGMFVFGGTFFGWIISKMFAFICNACMLPCAMSSWGGDSVGTFVCTHSFYIISVAGAGHPLTVSRNQEQDQHARDAIVKYAKMNFPVIAIKEQVCPTQAAKHVSSNMAQTNSLVVYANLTYLGVSNEATIKSVLQMCVNCIRMEKHSVGVIVLPNVGQRGDSLGYHSIREQNLLVERLCQSEEFDIDHRLCGIVMQDGDTVGRPKKMQQMYYMILILAKPLDSCFANSGLWERLVITDVPSPTRADMRCPFTISVSGENTFSREQQRKQRLAGKDWFCALFAHWCRTQDFCHRLRPASSISSPTTLLLSLLP